MKSRLLLFVIDADIARSAGPDPKARPWDDSAKSAHDVLEAIRRCKGFKVAFDPTLYEEWKRNMGNTARRWLADLASAGRVTRVGSVNKDWVIDLIRRHLTAGEWKEAEKDAHLIALAVDVADERILSNDEKARKRFAGLDDGKILEVHWVPSSEDARQWIMDGAPSMPKWQLGAS